MSHFARFLPLTFLACACYGTPAPSQSIEPLPDAQALPVQDGRASVAPNPPSDGLVEACGTMPPAGQRLLLGANAEIVVGLRGAEPLTVCIFGGCLLAQAPLEDGLQVNGEWTLGCHWMTAEPGRGNAVTFELDRQGGVIKLWTAPAATCELACP